MFNLEQAFDLMEDDEDTQGLDYKNFYFLMRCILAIKKYGKKQYGHVEEPEFKEMYEKHDFFK